MATKYPRTGSRDVRPADLEWLQGSWFATLGNALVEEHWSAHRGGMLLGMFRWTEIDQVRFYEIEAIESEAEFVYLRVRHFDSGLIAWEEKDKPHEFLLVQHDPERAVFFELGQTDTRWAVYERISEEELKVYFTHDQTPDEHPGVFNFTRSPDNAYLLR